MTYQTWLKNLKKLKRIWKPRRNPLVPEAATALHSVHTGLLPCSSLPDLFPQFLYCLRHQRFSSLLDYVIAEQKQGPMSRTMCNFSSSHLLMSSFQLFKRLKDWNYGARLANMTLFSSFSVVL